QVRGRRVRDGAPAPEGEDQALPRRDSGPGPPQQPPQGRQQTGEPEAVPGPHVALDDGAFRGRPECSRCGGLNPEYKGFGTGLKPGHEPVVVARKPMDTTVAANRLEHGTGASKIGAMRVHSEDAPVCRTRHGSGIPGNGSFYKLLDVRTATTAGRWPANVIMDEHMAGVLYEQSGVSKSADVGSVTNTKPRHSGSM